VECGRKGDDGRADFDEAVRRGKRRKVDPLREDVNELRAGRGLGLGDEWDSGTEDAEDDSDGNPAIAGASAAFTGVLSCTTGCSSSMMTGGKADDGREGDVDSGVLRSDPEGDLELGPDLALSEDGELEWLTVDCRTSKGSSLATGGGVSR
jgi:hypothetical protein